MPERQLEVALTLRRRQHGWPQEEAGASLIKAPRIGGIRCSRFTFFSWLMKRTL